MSLSNSPDMTTLKFLLRPKPIGVTGTVMEDVESLSSWLHRLAQANGLHDPLRFVFGEHYRAVSQIEKLLVGPTYLADLANATGRTVDELQMMVFFSQPSPISRGKQFNFKSWLLRGMGRTTPHVVCPTCVNEDSSPYWRKSWRLSVIVDCLVHGTPMVEKCDECGRKFALCGRAVFPLSCCAWCGASIRYTTSKAQPKRAPSVWRDFFHSFPYKGQPPDTKPLFGDLAIAMQVFNLLLSYAQAAEVGNDWFHRYAGIPLATASLSEATFFPSATIDERRQVLKFVAAVMAGSRDAFHELTQKGDIRYSTLEALSFVASGTLAKPWPEEERRIA